MKNKTFLFVLLSILVIGFLVLRFGNYDYETAKNSGEIKKTENKEKILVKEITLRYHTAFIEILDRLIKTLDTQPDKIKIAYTYYSSHSIIIYFYNERNILTVGSFDKKHYDLKLKEIMKDQNGLLITRGSHRTYWYHQMERQCRGDIEIEKRCTKLFNYVEKTLGVSINNVMKKPMCDSEILEKLKNVSETQFEERLKKIKKAFR